MSNLLINSFQWWLSLTKTLGQEGSFFDCQNIDYRKNPEFITLNRKVTEQSWTIPSKPNAIALTNYQASSNLIDEVNVFCEDWKIYEASTGEIYSTGGSPIYNIANLNGYNYLLCSDRIERFQNAVRSNVLATDNFSSGWTGTNWSAGTHTAWSTTAYTQSSPITTVSGERYHIVVEVISQSAWTCTVSIGWTTSSNLVVGRNDIYLVTSTTAWISFNPSSTSTIVLSYVRVDRVSTLASPDGLWVDNGWKTLTTSNVTKRPFINFYWDLIFGNGSSVARLNKDDTVIEYNSTTEWPVIGGLDWTVYAITQISTNVYVWCNNGANTNLYMWDGVSSRPSQKLTISDRPIINTALLSNQHYWWSQKWVKSQKFVHIGENLQNQVIVKSDIPRDPTSASNYPEDRLALYGEQTNAIETFWDYIFLPGYGEIFSFGKYYPWLKASLNKEFSFNGGECTAMLTTSNPWTGYSSLVTDYFLLLTYQRSSNYYLGIVDFREWNGNYASSGYIETMEYSNGNSGAEKNLSKIIVPIMLGNSACSIKVYTNIDQAGYSELKTLNSTNNGTGFTLAEITPSVSKWHTLQYKFELITSSATYSPRLYVWVNTLFEQTALK